MLGEIRHFFRGFLTSAALVATAASCSPGMFGSGVDTTVASRPGYRHLNEACSRLDVSGPALDATTFRGLVKCLNSNGAIDAVQKLLDRTSDADIEPILSTFNRYWLSDPARVFQVERTYDDLAAKGLLEPLFRDFGRLLSNDEFWTEFVLILEKKYSTSSKTEVLKFLERVGRKLTPENAASGLDAAISLTGARAFGSLQKRFRGPSPSGRAIRDVTDPFLEYLKPSADPASYAAGRELLARYANGELFQALDGTLGSGDELKQRVPELGALLSVVSRDQGRILNGLTSLFHYLHRPIACLGGSKVLPDADMYVLKATWQHPISQAGDFLRRENMLTLMTLGPLCDYPPELGRFYPYLYEVADTNTVEAIARVVHGFYGVERTGADGKIRRPMAELLISILSNTGSRGPGLPAEDTAGVKLLTPLIAELADRGAWEDLLLLITLVRPEDRAGFGRAIAWFLERDPALGNMGVYDVLMDGLATQQPADLARFIGSLKGFIDTDEPLIHPALENLRLALHVNDAHPFIGMTSALLREATANEAFFTALFKVTKLPEFRGTIRLFSEMGADGRLKELAQVLVTLYHRFSLAGQSNVRSGSAPQFKPLRAHDLAKADLPAFPVRLVNADVYRACGRLDLRSDLSQVTGPGYPALLDSYLGCVNHNGAQVGTADSIRFLNSERTEGGKSFLGFTFGLVRSLNLEPAQQGYVADAFLSGMGDGRVDRLVRVLPFFASREVRGVEDAPGARGTLLRPVVAIVSSIFERARGSLKRPQEWLAGLLERADVPQILRHLDRLSNVEPGPYGRPVPAPYDRARIERWIKNKQCAILRGNDSQRVLEGEIQRVISDHLPERQSASGTPPTTGGVWDPWEFKDLKPFLDPLFQRFANPNESHPDRPVLKAILNVLRYFTLPAGARADQTRHFQPEEFLRWLHEHSSDQKLVTYYYPKDRENPDAGYEEHPRVRVVNSLERLEMIFNADINPPVLSTNDGYEYLSLFGRAWGDEDRSVWPPEIQREFPDPRKPPLTLAQAAVKLRRRLETLTRLVGLPEGPNCRQLADPNDPPELQREETTDREENSVVGVLVPNKDAFRRRIFNLHHLAEVVDDMIPRRRADGTEYAGLKVLRDLFFELYYSSPEQYRTSREDCEKRHTSGPNRGEWKENLCRNNLWVIMKVARAGLLHQIARQLRSIPPNEPAMKDLFATLTSAAGSNHAELSRIFETLVRRDPQRKLLWGVTEQVFKILDSREQADRDTLKQLGYYAMANFSSLKILNPTIKTVGAVVDRHHDFLARNTGLVGDALKSKSGAKLLRVLYEDPDAASRERLASVARDALSRPELTLDLLDVLALVDTHPTASRQWKLLRSRFDVVRELPEYRALEFDDLRQDLLEFIREDSADPRARATARRLRAYLTERLRERDLEQFGVLAQRRPDEFYQVLKTLGDSADRGDLMHFLKIIQTSLSETTP